MKHEESFDAFVAQVRSKCERGAQEYGDKSFDKEPHALVSELQQELLDICGWGWILWRRLERMRDALEPPQMIGIPSNAQANNPVITDCRYCGEPIRFHRVRRRWLHESNVDSALPCLAGMPKGASFDTCLWCGEDYNQCNCARKMVPA